MESPGKTVPEVSLGMNERPCNRKIGEDGIDVNTLERHRHADGVPAAILSSLTDYWAVA